MFTGMCRRLLVKHNSFVAFLIPQNFKISKIEVFLGCLLPSRITLS